MKVDALNFGLKGQCTQLQHSDNLSSLFCVSSCPWNAPVCGRAVFVTPFPVCGPGDHVLAPHCLMLGSQSTSMARPLDW